MAIYAEEIGVIAETALIYRPTRNQATSQASDQVARLRRLLQEQFKGVMDFKMVF